MFKQGPLEHLSQDCAQAALNISSEGNCNLSEQPVPVLSNLHVKDAPPHVQVELPVFHFLPTAPHAFAWHY